MNGKFIGIVIGAVVAIMLVGGVLMPAINDASTHTEIVTPDGAFGPTVGYISDIPVPTSNVSFYGVSYDVTTTKLTASRVVNGDNVNVIDDLRSNLPDKMIIYADDNETVYIDGLNLYCVNNEKVYDLSTGDRFGVGFGYRDENYRYAMANQGYFDKYTPITYEYITGMDGNYTNITGDNPPSMDTPSVSAAGMYIGINGTETETQSPGYAIYMAIPVIILVSLLVAVAMVAFKRQY